MFQLKSLSKEAVGRALEKAERYRLLNEPEEADSICLDVLEVDPDNQKALVTLLLARTDRFMHGAGSPEAAREVLPRLKDAYERAYYTGIIYERRASAVLTHGVPGSHFIAYDLLRQAMEEYERAEAMRPPGNDDALLRWNTCARILNANPGLRPREEERMELPLE
jgi:tetratricopeptide (TPR) repeat protein